MAGSEESFRLEVYILIKGQSQKKSLLQFSNRLYKKNCHHSKDHNSSVKMYGKTQEQNMDFEAIYESDEDTTGPRTLSYIQAKGKALQCSK